MVNDQLTKAWEIESIGMVAPDPLSETAAPVLSAHSYLVSDAGGVVLRDNNLEQNDAFVYRAYAEATGNRRPLDGPLGTVVAHEWGHYLHHRLANCGNSQQCAGMSEGWGDFNALLMMVREGDNPPGRLRRGAVRGRRRLARHRVLRHPPVPVQPRPHQERPQLPAHR